MAVMGGSCMAGATANGNGNGGEDNVWPPGFRFHPTDEELVLYYLKRKICKRKLKLDIIREIDVYKWDPEELPGQSLLKTGDRQWFFFSPRDRKYPNGARSNRATRQGYWKATGKDRTIACNSRSVGLKKTLVFYRGRSPSGGRTDWVMHEYTLDEEELSRCPNVQDYYALYKVFKKSGPGPKNGEQYGAPFKEEDWVDDECADANNSNTVDTSAKQLVEAAPDNSDKIIVPVEQSVDELDELLKQFMDVPELGLPLLNDDTYLKPKVVCGEQTQSTVVDSVVTEVTYVEPLAGLPPNGQQQGQEVSFDFCQATASLQPDGGPEAIFVLNSHVEEAQLSLKDYLEMDDFLESKPAFTNVEGPGEDLQFGGFDEHHELNMYHDADMFLRDVGQIDKGTVFYPQTNSPGIEMENQVGYQSQAYSIGSQGFTQLQSHLVASEMNFQIQPGSFAGEQISDQLRIHDEASCVLSSPEFQGTLSQLAPGVEYGVMGSRPGANQNLSSEQGTSTSSRFASSMWSFLESIPSHPASASESPSVNKAFERMSSFSRLRMNAKSPVVNTESGAANARKASVNRPFLLLSILGALCAMLWVVLTGTEKVLGRRSVSS